MAHEVTLIPGDGIGPEITKAMLRVVEATGADIAWDVQEAGASVMDEEGTPLPQRVLDSISRTGCALKGPVTTPLGTGFRSVNVALRKAFDLYACLRPCHSMPGDGSRYEGVDIVIVRENTEDLYTGVEFDVGSEGARRIIADVAAEGLGTIRPDSAISLKPISVSGSERIVRYAFEYARKHGRHKVTAVHKSNIMKCTDGLFMRTAQRIAAEYPELEFETVIVDACCMRVVMDPSEFDVIVLPNLYGDMMSDLCAGLVGGLGLAPGANIGEHEALFEATHGSAPDIAGKDVANPTAMILSAAMMLDHLGERASAEAIRTAVRETLADGSCVTADIRRALSGSVEGSVGTQAYADAVATRVSELR